MKYGPKLGKRSFLIPLHWFPSKLSYQKTPPDTTLTCVMRKFIYDCYKILPEHRCFKKECKFKLVSPLPNKYLVRLPRVLRILSWTVPSVLLSVLISADMTILTPNPYYLQLTWVLSIRSCTIPSLSSSVLLSVDNCNLPIMFTFPLFWGLPFFLKSKKAWYIWHSCFLMKIQFLLTLWIVVGKCFRGKSQITELRHKSGNLEQFIYFLQLELYHLQVWMYLHHGKLLVYWKQSAVCKFFGRFAFRST